jgi:hypothetical protein
MKAGLSLGVNRIYRNARERADPGFTADWKL